MAAIGEMVRQEREGALPVFPAAELLVQLVPRVRGIWQSYVDTESMQEQDREDRVQATLLRLLERMGPQCSVARSRKLVAWCIADVWRSVLGRRGDERPAELSGGTVPDQSKEKRVASEYLRRPTSRAEIAAGVREARQRRLDRWKGLTERALSGLPSRYIREDVRDLRRSDHVIRRRLIVSEMPNGITVYPAGQGSAAMLPAWRRSTQRNGNAVRANCNSLETVSADVQWLPGNDVFPGVALYAPPDREERIAYVNWLTVFAR